MKWGLVLSGGAALGLSNAGVLRVLEAENLKSDSIAGSSMGAIIGALYAYTGSTAALEKLCDSLTLTNAARLSDNPLKDGLHGGLFRQHLALHLDEYLGDATIADCRIPFVCVAGRVKKPVDWLRIVRPGFTDHILECVEVHVFEPQTRLIDAIMASSAIPVIFSPVKIGKDTFVDLVHFGAIPARTLRSMHNPDVIIATDTNPEYGALVNLLPASWKEFLDRGYAELEKSKRSCDLVIRPAAPAAVFRFDKASAFLEAGEKAAREKLPEIVALLKR